MEEVTLNSQIKTATIDNIIYTALSGDVKVSVDTEKKIAKITGGKVDISENFFQASAGYTFEITDTATINGIDYDGNGSVKFGTSHWDVTLDEDFSAGNGSQSLGGLNLTATGNISFKLHANGGTDTVTINGIKCLSKSDGEVSVKDGVINISGDVSAANFLKVSDIKTSGDGEINLLLAENDNLTFDGLKCEVTEPAIISIKNGNVTSTSGAFQIKTPNSTSLTLNGVNYTSNGDSSITINEGNASLTGKFKVKLGSDELKLNNINIKGNAGTEFNFDSSDKNFTNADDIEISATYGRSFKVEGVAITVDGESSNVSFKDKVTTLNGNCTVGDGSTSLSNKNFSVSAGEISFKPKSSDTNIKINDTTFSGATNLTANFANTDAVKVEGTGVKIEGEGNFIIASADGFTLNGTTFQSTTAYSNIIYNENDGYTLQTPFTVGDGTKNLSGLKISNNSIIKGSTFKLGTNDDFTLSGVNYSGDGEIFVDEQDATEIKLTGNFNISKADGKTYTVDDKAEVTFDFAADESVTINGKTYKASSTGSIVVKDGTAEMNGSFLTTGDEVQVYEFKQSASVTDAQGITYTAQSTNAKLTVDDENKKIKISSGNVAINFSDTGSINDYTFNIAQNSTAQINGIDFKQTGATSNATNGDVVFTAADSVTLYSPFTIGDGTQKLNGLKVTLATTETSTFNLGADDSVTIIQTGESPDVTTSGTSARKTTILVEGESAFEGCTLNTIPYAITVRTNT